MLIAGIILVLNGITGALVVLFVGGVVGGIIIRALTHEVTVVAGGLDGIAGSAECSAITVDPDVIGACGLVCSA